LRGQILSLALAFRSLARVGGGEVLASTIERETMRISNEELRILRLAVEDWSQEQEEGGTASQEELETAEKLWQKLGREVIKRQEKVGA